jgi:hypothetical protein
VFQHEPASGFAEVHALGAWLRVQPPREVGRENRGAAGIDHSAKSHGHHAAHQQLTTLQKFKHEQSEVVEGKELVQAGHWREPLLPARALAAPRRGRRHAGLLVFGCTSHETILIRFMKTQNETQLKSARLTLSYDWSGCLYLASNKSKNLLSSSCLVINAGCASTGCASTGCVSTGCASTGCASTGCASTGCASTGCAQHRLRMRKATLDIHAVLSVPALAGALPARHLRRRTRRVNFERISRNFGA